MATAVSRDKQDRSRFWDILRGLRSWRTVPEPAHLCPRCAARYEDIGCLACGWVPDTSVACSDAEMLREGKAVA